MRNRIAALVVCATAVACGDSSGPESDLAPGVGKVTVSGALNESDSMIAGAFVAPGISYGPPLVDVFVALVPAVPRGSVGTGRVRTAFQPLFPFFLALDVSAPSDSIVGTHQLSPAVTATIFDSIGMTSTGSGVQDSMFPMSLPSYDALLEGASGSVTLSRADSIAVMGSFTITAKSKTGRMVNATGRFNAKVVPIPPGGNPFDSLSLSIHRRTISPPPPFSRARR
jgi:hypothetical protein